MSGFWYLATPYSLYPTGIQAAFTDACHAAASLIRAGVPVFCPIAHTHPIAMVGEIDPLDHEIWLPADRPMMDAAKGLIVCKLYGWEESRGVAFEIETFKAAGKPILYLAPGEIHEDLKS